MFMEGAMQASSRKFHLLVGLVAGLALLSLGGARMAAAETIDLSAILTSDCAPDGADLAFLDDMQAGGTATPPAAGSTSTAPAEPAGGGKACKTNKQCGKGMWCAKENGKCKEEGTCKQKPTICPEVVAPVCGCNHKTYNNECMAQRAGVNVSHTGKCEKKGKGKGY
jgi:hypothetical protein